jgi:uncharacterized hydrophobic protein (TIGR00271 family)
VFQLRVICPADLTDGVIERLTKDPGVVTMTVQRGIAVQPEGDVLVCEVVRERANTVLGALRTLGVERRGAVSVVQIDAIASHSERATERHVPGHDADALPWVLLEETARDEAEPSVTFHVLMAVAAVIAAVGIMVDSPVLIIGAMIVGPEYGPLVAVAIGLRRRLRIWRPALGVLLLGLVTAMGAATATTFIARLLGQSEASLEPAGRFFTSFVTDPNAFSAVVAFAAGVAGIIALARAQATAVAGVLVSVTTIPAAAAIGVDLATGEWADLAGAALQLVINLVALVVAGVATLAVYDRSWSRQARVSRRTRLP